MLLPPGAENASYATVQHVSDLHSKFALGPHHASIIMVDIQSATAEIRRGKKKKYRRKKPQDKNNDPVLHRAAITKMLCWQILQLVYLSTIRDI